MRVLYIPSWWPHRHAPVVGIFSREQIVATARLRPGWRLAVSTWGQGEYDLALRRPREWPSRLAAYLRAGPARVELEPNLVEHRRRALTWARQVADGNLRAITRANRSVLEAAEVELGGVDLIHAHVSYPGGAVALRLREETGIPYVVSEHWHYPPRPFVLRDGTLDDRLRAPLAAADAVLAVSSSHARDMAECGVPWPEVVPPAVDEEEFLPGPSTVSDGPLVVLGVCNMVEGKGVDDLLSAVAALQSSERERLSLRLGGSGPALPRYQRLARDIGVADRVTWLGMLSRAQVKREMRSCDLFALPSRRESFGIVYAEAQACGKPVLAARAGGPEDIVAPETGILVEPGDVAGLAAALREALERRGSWDARAIRKRFESRFSRPVVVQKLDDLYRRVLAASA